MFWADKFADQIIKSKKHQLYWVDDMKTPSGRVHVGALRGVVIHGLIHQALLDRGVKSVNSYVINDMDPMDGFPHYLPESFREHMGKPLFQVPSPEKGHNSMARLYGKQFIKVFNSLGFKPKIIWSSEEYEKGRFDEVIKTALDEVKKVRELYHEVSGYDKPDNWYPYQVICPKCGKVGTTITTGWDGKKVSFECRKDLVKWAEGCGYKGEIEPKGTNGKLMWKMDWAAHWKVIGITVEGAGKDHMTEGGSHDLSSQLVEKILDYPTPFGFLYEWFLAKGGAKMSSSKGVGTSALEISQTLPPEVLRFLLVKTPYRKAIVFEPSDNDSILDLFDEYDKATEAYYKDGGEDDLGRAWQLSQISAIPKEKVYLPRFRDVVNYVQSPSVDLVEKFEEIKGSKLNEEDKKELNKRVKYAKIWLDKYAPEKKKVGVLIDSIEVDLNDNQKKYLKLLIDLLKKEWQAEELQQEMYQMAKDNEINPRDAFQAVYLSLTGKKYGPKAAWFLLDQDKDKLIDTLSMAIVKKKSIKKKENLIPDLTDSNLLSVSDVLKKKYPSVVAGVAIIEGITIKDNDEDLDRENDELVRRLSAMTMSELNESVEIQSYRKLYREMKIDWGSRKSSPAALIRRIIKGQGLYKINTCVDAYNHVVMKHRISAGAFDLDQVKFPAIIDVAKGGEKALYIGDKEPTDLKDGEVCYFDQEGPYNLDFNYRDAIRTSVTKKTKNIIINVEGIYDISRNQVETSLNEVVEKIIKYCGGELKTIGILEASK